MSAIHDIADYARSNGLEDADELLTEFLAMIGRRSGPLPRLAPVPPEDQVPDALVSLHAPRAKGV